MLNSTYHSNISSTVAVKACRPGLAVGTIAPFAIGMELWVVNSDQTDQGRPGL